MPNTGRPHDPVIGIPLFIEVRMLCWGRHSHSLLTCGKGDRIIFWVSIVLSNANNIELVNHVVVELADHLDIHVRVQLLQLSDRCLSSCLVSDVVLFLT